MKHAHWFAAALALSLLPSCALQAGVTLETKAACQEAPQTPQEPSAEHDPLGHLRHAFHLLNDHAAPQGPARISVGLAELSPNLLGLTTMEPGPDGVPHFRIYLSAQSDHTEQVRILIHEWAHVLAWRAGTAFEPDHGTYWAVSYGYCYQLVLTGELDEPEAEEPEDG
ncbi:MAG: hypothetical protein GY716_16125 [bacterium]|nr:hypothetical protein [bacterium]